MEFKIFIACMFGLGAWIFFIKPLIDDILFDRAMREEDEELERKKDSQHTIAHYRKQYFPERRRLIVK